MLVYPSVAMVTRDALRTSVVAGSMDYRGQEGRVEIIDHLKCGSLLQSNFDEYPTEWKVITHILRFTRN